jgi:hypothetical protein
MSTTTNDWITNRIAKAKAGQPLLTDSAATRMDHLVRDRLTSRPLTAAELTAVAKQLIGDMVPPLPETETKQ